MPEPLNDEQFIQRRMLLAAVLSAVVMGAYVYFSPRPERPEPPPPAAGESAPAAEPARATVRTTRTPRR